MPRTRAIATLGAWALGSIVVAVLVAVAISAPPPASAAGGKNLQVLPKDMSKKEIKLRMRAMGKALGVKCGYCHKGSNMSADTEMKEVARDMMRMVNEVNGTHLKGSEHQVDCRTCHRGKKKPKR